MLFQNRPFILEVQVFGPRMKLCNARVEFSHAFLLCTYLKTQRLMTYATLAHAEARFPVTAKHKVFCYIHMKRFPKTLWISINTKLCNRCKASDDEQQ